MYAMIDAYAHTFIFMFMLVFAWDLWTETRELVEIGNLRSKKDFHLVLLA